MHGFIVRWARKRMESANETDEAQDERQAQPPEASERRPELKLRDLRTEKDPMGAGKQSARGAV
jgi:hypothetical protein